MLLVNSIAVIIYTGTLTLRVPSSSCLFNFNAPRAAFFTCYTASFHSPTRPPAPTAGT